MKITKADIWRGFFIFSEWAYGKVQKEVTFVKDDSGKPVAAKP